MPLGELRRAPVLRELARREVQLLAAVQPKDAEDVAPLVERARELGLSIGLWPLLEDEAGRWLHPGNAAAFERFIEELLSGLERRGLSVDALALDLEPPIAEVKRVTEGRLGAARAWLGRPLDRSAHARITASVRARGVEVVAAVIPAVLTPGRASEGWQRALGTPIDARYDALSAMLYTSLFEGYSFQLVRREDARALLDHFARRARSRFGERASVSLGAVGRGALGDERTYRGPAELTDDVAIARAAGVDDIALFDLAGVLARPPIEPWLDALLETSPASAPPPSTKRAQAILGALAVTGVALSLAGQRSS